MGLWLWGEVCDPWFWRMRCQREASIYAQAVLRQFSAPPFPLQSFQDAWGKECWLPFVK